MNRAERRRELKRMQKQAAAGARRDAYDGDALDAARQVLEDAKRLHNSGKRSEAVSIYKKILSSIPNQPEVLHLLGIAVFQEGKDLEAVEFLEKSIEFGPERANVHNDLGNIYSKLEKFEKAIEQFTSAVGLQQDFANSYYNLGYANMQLKQWDEAVSNFRKTIEVEPDNIVAQNALGVVLKDLGDFEGALHCFETVLSINPSYLRIYANLGMTLLALGRREEALKYLKTSLELARGSSEGIQPKEEAEYTTFAKLSHDIEQFEYLADLGIDGSRFQELAKLYQTVKEEIVWPEEKTNLVCLSSKHREALKPTYVRPVHLVRGDAVTNTAINENLNTKEITDAYNSRKPGMIYFDDFLSPEALMKLRTFLLQSTIWFKYNYSGGYLGAMFADGLACPILLQIAENTRQKFPEILGQHALCQLWAYKYDSELHGIGLHADFAAVNLNFWVTPTSANLDPSAGGLVVYDAEAPSSWNFDTYNKNPERIRNFLNETESGKMVVPYLQNRAVMFNSNLFHETDTVKFKNCYENRRINITMLFGKRD